MLRLGWRLKALLSAHTVEFSRQCLQACSRMQGHAQAACMPAASACSPAGSPGGSGGVSGMHSSEALAVTSLLTGSAGALGCLSGSVRGLLSTSPAQHVACHSYSAMAAAGSTSAQRAQLVAARHVQNRTGVCQLQSTGWHLDYLHRAPRHRPQLAAAGPVRRQQNALLSGAAHEQPGVLGVAAHWADLRLEAAVPVQPLLSAWQTCAGP